MRGDVSDSRLAESVWSLIWKLETSEMVRSRISVDRLEASPRRGNARAGSVRVGLDPWTLTAFGAFTAFAILTAIVASGTPIPLDQSLLDVARGWSSLSDFWVFISESANFPLIIVAIGIVGWLLLQRRPKDALLIFLVLAAATAGSEAVKELVARPRPVDTRVLAGVVYSYPSGHILEALTIYGIISFKVWASSLPRWVRWTQVAAVVVFVTLVGVARMALGAHYPSDVLGGLLAGIGVLATYRVLSARRLGFGLPAGGATVPGGLASRPAPKADAP